MREDILKVLSKVLNISLDSIDDNSSIYWDSLTKIEVIISLEELIGVQFNVDEVKFINSLQDLIKLLETRNII